MSLPARLERQKRLPENVNYSHKVLKIDSLSTKDIFTTHGLAFARTMMRCGVARCAHAHNNNNGMCEFEIVSIKEWWKGTSIGESDCVERLPIVDIRESQDRQTLSANDAAVVVRLPFYTLLSGERSYELPPRHVPFVLLTDENVLDSARAFFGATSSKATQQSRKPWLVPQVLLSNDSFWKDASNLGIVKDEYTKSTMENNSFKIQSRLWQPDPLVKNVLWPLLRDGTTVSSPPPPHSEQVWDLGSGAGRDVCFLAEQAKASGKQHYTFVGIDNHKGSVKRCLPFWKHRHVEDYTEARNLNLNKIPLVEDEMTNQTVVCLYAVRFWNEKLVKCIAANGELKPGTLFGVSHFCKPYPGAPWDFDHPKVRCCIFGGVHIEILSVLC